MSQDRRKTAYLKKAILQLTLIWILLAGIMIGSAYGDELQTFKNPKNSIEVVGESWSLTGPISLNILVQIPTPLQNQVTGEITHFGNTFTSVPELYKSAENGNIYSFNCEIMIPNDKDPVSLMVFDENNNALQLTVHNIPCQENKYITDAYHAFSQAEQMGGSYKEYAQATKQYCERVRQYFNRHPDSPYDVCDYPIVPSLLSPFGASFSELPQGIEFCGFEISFEETSLLILFNVSENANANDLAFSIDGNLISLSWYRDNLWYLKIPRIPVMQYGTSHTISIGNSVLSNISLLSCAYEMVSNEDAPEELKQMYTAMYYSYITEKELSN